LVVSERELGSDRLRPESRRIEWQSGVEVMTYRIHGGGSLQVDDSGPGTEVHERDRVFDRFLPCRG